MNACKSKNRHVKIVTRGPSIYNYYLEELVRQVIKKLFILVALALLFAMMTGCGNEITTVAGQTSNDGSASSHNQHATQPDVAERSNSNPVKKVIYSLDATSYKENGSFYIKATTDLKLSSEHYGGKPVDGEGHIHVYVDGKIVGPIKDDTPFSLPLIEKGTYEIKLVLAENNHAESFGVSTEFSVEKKE